MTTVRDESEVVYPEVFTLHWEGPAAATPPHEIDFGERADAEAECAQAAREAEVSEAGGALWERIRGEALRRGDAEHWERRLEAYAWVKLERCGNAADFARRFEVNHATVRTWIADVSKLAYQVGYRLHEDRLLLVGEAPPELDRLRELVNRDAGSDAAWAELERLAPRLRGEDPYFHLNEGHAQRARHNLRASDETLRDGLAVAEAPAVRALLWNARGQTLWECDAQSGWPLPDHLERAERAFRRAALLDQSTYFPFVNLAQLGADVGDLRRADYWLGELAIARKAMNDEMQDDLARYLGDAEWRAAVSGRRAWKTGPARWLRAAARKGAIALAAVVFALGLFSQPAAASTPRGDESPGVAAKSPPKARSGAGGN